MTPARITLAFTVAAIGFLAPSPASASWMGWYNQCATGAFQACASVEVSMVYNADTDRTALAVRVSNLQGTLPGLGQYGVQHIRIDNVVTTYSGPLQGSFLLGPGTGMSAEGNADLAGMFGELWGLHQSNYIEAFGQQGATPIWGCDGHPAAYDNPWFPSTCGGWIVFAMEFQGRWELTDATTMSFDATDGAGASVSCTTGTDCQTVVPEPLTVVLLSTGLAGLGALRARRRKKDDVA